MRACMSTWARLGTDGRLCVGTSRAILTRSAEGSPGVVDSSVRSIWPLPPSIGSALLNSDAAGSASRSERIAMRKRWSPLPSSRVVGHLAIPCQPPASRQPVAHVQLRRAASLTCAASNAAAACSSDRWSTRKARASNLAKAVYVACSESAAARVASHSSIGQSRQLALSSIQRMRLRGTAGATSGEMRSEMR